MFTNNARDLAVGAHQLTAFTDERGRLQGLADLVCESDDRFLLVLDGLDAASFAELFRIHLMLEDVEVTSAGTSWYVSKAPQTGTWWSTPIGGWMGVTNETPPGSDLPLNEFELRRILAGVPSFADASSKQLPHELGLRDTHLHFEKGCYRGQEIIHRVDVMGQVRKGLAGVVLHDATGSELRADGKRVGRLGTTAEHPELGRIGLAVVRNGCVPGTVLSCGDGTATVHALPFA